MLCLNCHQPRTIESETPGERRYARCDCGAIGVISKAELDEQATNKSNRKQRKTNA